MIDLFENNDFQSIYNEIITELLKLFTTRFLFSIENYCANFPIFIVITFI